MPRNCTTIIPDTEHDLAFVEQTRAWVAERDGGKRVSITWVRQPDESLNDFQLQAKYKAFRVLQFISSGDRVANSRHI
jgi:hypothetical protein